MERIINTYSSLEDIRQRKAKINFEIMANEKRISQLWSSLFHPDNQKEIKSPSRKVLSLVNNSIGLLDGVILGWKLYRRFIK